MAWTGGRVGQGERERLIYKPENRTHLQDGDLTPRRNITVSPGSGMQHCRAKDLDLELGDKRKGLGPKRTASDLAFAPPPAVLSVGVSSVSHNKLAQQG